VPVALLGLCAYAVILASLIVPQREATRFTTMAVTLAGFAFSVYLTYRELYSIHAICEWCVSSAIIMTLLLIGAVVRYLTTPAFSGPALAPTEAYAGDDGIGAALEHDSPGVATR
jgi:uncharacterized membrane protein